MEWFKDEKALGEAVDYLLRYSCCYSWKAFASDKTPCCNYKEEDKSIPNGLRSAISEYLNNLSKEAYCDLNREIALLLGERFYVRKQAVIKILSRMLADGDPCKNTDMIKFALQMQIKQRMNLLESLRAS